MFGLRRYLKKLAPATPQDPIPHAIYGKIYAPWYNLHRSLPSDIPEIYNARGERLDLFFLRDLQFADFPNSQGMYPSHWLWDRFNFGLKTHFYTQDEMLRTMGHPDRRYGAFVESPAILPRDYEIFNRHPGLEKDFDAVFTYDDRLLNSLANAKFVPFAAAPWYGVPGSDSEMDPNACEKKTKHVSMVCSRMVKSELHRYRLQLAIDCKRQHLADTYGTFDGGPYLKSLREVLQDYRYSVMIENDISPYYFSERLTSCFAAMTVPIYCGADQIGKFFNEDGIVKIRPGDDPVRVLSQCSERDYRERLPAIRDNFNRVQEYLNIWDWMWSRYLA